MELRRLLLGSLALAATVSAFATAPWVSEKPASGAFPLFQTGQAAAIIASADDATVVGLATRDLAADIERVTGKRPALQSGLDDLASPLVLVGTLGKNALIDGLVKAGKLDVAELRGQWESFILTTIAEPFPGVAQALIIVGSDRRGTAFGIYELSQAIGVSPWYWWADVVPEKKASLYIAAGTRRFGPPSVQYRGIFLNDEDWGLQPWAAKTFEPEVGDIGPKTYARICELLLRLKANTLWPAMHACTKAFNHYPQNKMVADDHAIVMGSSHAEPMLRNNVSEWTAPPADYNYIANRDGVHAYWEKRVQENGRFENIYTLGMRGIHDSNMQGPKTDAERIATLEQIFADQRALIEKHVNPDVERVPQMFCAYKEVLDLYRQGLKVPDDVTIVWPDDNFGYIRNFATAEEQKRRGGFGVYYHISYLGRPLSYLWLSTTPPALIWSEMSKAYEHGARKIWIVNVGDLKPGEIGTEFFLQMAWDIDRWNPDNLSEFLPQWAAREFGLQVATETSSILARYFQLNFERRPEHLQWWLPGKPAVPSTFSTEKIDERLSAFTALRERVIQTQGKLPPAARAAFTQLVAYPVHGSALANSRYFSGERGETEQAHAFDAELKELTRHFNEDLAEGKWRGFISLEPANHEWKSMRIAPWSMPTPPFPRPHHEDRNTITIPADSFSAQKNGVNSAWRKITGLGTSSAGVTILPTNTPASPALSEGPALSYPVNFPSSGLWTLVTFLRPTHPITAGHGLQFALSLNDGTPQRVSSAVLDGSPEWAQGVLNNFVAVETTIAIPAAGVHTLHVYGVDAGVVLDHFTFTPNTPPTVDH